MTKMIRTMALSAAAGAVLLSVSMMSTGAQAADLDMYVAPPPPLPVMTWTGPYIGGFVGGGALHVDVDPDFIEDDTAGSGFMFGGFLGYNFQVSPAFVLGVQGDVTAPDFDGKDIDAEFDNDVVWSLSARAGWLMTESSMFYAIGGWSNTRYDIEGFDQKKTFNGFHVGGGIETKVTDAISIRAEYRYTNFGSKNVDGYKFKPETHTGMIGVAYNFGSLF